MSFPNNLIVILGPTASGKTRVAALVADKLDGEVISADSRQVYRNMDIGTGKDLHDYEVDEKCIKYHLIDIVEAGYKYNVYEYQQDFYKVFDDIRERQKLPILCGGSGMYIEAVLKGYKLTRVPVNDELRSKLGPKSMEELVSILESMKSLHNVSDTTHKKRLIRAIEIETYHKENEQVEFTHPELNYIIFGIKYDRASQRKRITDRLEHRLSNGMIDEVKQLMEKGLSDEQVMFYGLEYKFITLYLTGEISYQEMFSKLNTAIHQFAKRQMTWFRKMERNGMKIHWLDGYMPDMEKVDKIVKSVVG